MVLLLIVRSCVLYHTPLLPPVVCTYKLFTSNQCHMVSCLRVGDFDQQWFMVLKHHAVYSDQTGLSFCLFCHRRTSVENN